MSDVLKPRAGTEGEREKVGVRRAVGMELVSCLELMVSMSCEGKAGVGMAGASGRCSGWR